MNSKPSNKTEEWNKKWDSADHGLTWVGKLMLKSKQKTLREMLKKLEISTAIDVGCGLGYMLSTFNDLGINTIGVDISPAAVEICRQKNLRAEKKSLEEVDGKYDLVFSDGLLEHFLNFEPLAKKMTEISNKYVLIIQTDHSSFWGKTSIYFAELLRGSKNVLEYNYRIEDFVAVFKKYNFDLISNKKNFGGIFHSLLFKTRASDHNQNRICHNEQFADKYLNLVNNPLLKFFRQFRMRELEIMKYLNKDDKIFDCGCGTGFCLDYLKGRGYNNLYGCEIQDNLIEMLPRYRVKRVSIENLKTEYPENYFDKIIVHDVFHHLFNTVGYQKAIEGLRYVLKPNAYLFIAEPDENWFWKAMLWSCKNFYFVPWLRPTWDGYLTERREFGIFFDNQSFLNKLFKDNFKIIKQKRSFYRKISILQK